MTNSESETTGGSTEGIGDAQLPEDLQPSEDNPLAEPLSERDDAHDIDDLDMEGGKVPEESAESDGSSEGDESDGDSGS